MRMIKCAFIAAVITGTLITSAFASEWAVDRGSAYTKGSKSLSLGIAAVPFGFAAAYDYGFHEAISGGGAMALIFGPDAYVPLLARASFHFFNIKGLGIDRAVREKLDIFLGLACGFEFGGPSPFIIREHLGVRFFFDRKYAIFIDDCAGLVSLGLTVKM